MKTLLLLFATALFLVADDDFAYKKLGGDASSSSYGECVFCEPVKKMNEEERMIFSYGRSFFRTPWVEAPSATTARDGIGPLFNANTCINCHPNNGAGVAVKQDGTMTRSLLLRLSHKTSNDSACLKKCGFEPDSTYGAQLSLNGNHDVPFEGKAKVTYKEQKGSYHDGGTFSLREPTYTIENLNYGALDKESIFAPRIALALVGLGRLELIDEKDILAHQDINDSNKDGISGKANYAWSPKYNKTMLGRFTWKASVVSVKAQTAAAAYNDMSLTNPFFPKENCTKKQKECLKAPKGRYAFDLPANRLDAIAYYLRNLAVPNQREPEKHIEGAKLFSALNCTGCHVTTYKTTKGDTIHPFSDLLLHDMGEALADGRREFLANGNEWRTPPLWGIGLYKRASAEANYLHDGRARSIEEAILWHGGEAQKSKEKFMALDKKEREKILNFLSSL